MIRQLFGVLRTWVWNVSAKSLIAHACLHQCSTFQGQIDLTVFSVTVTSSNQHSDSITVETTGRPRRSSSCHSGSTSSSLQKLSEVKTSVKRDNVLLTLCDPDPAVDQFSFFVFCFLSVIVNSKHGGQFQTGKLMPMSIQIHSTTRSIDITLVYFIVLLSLI